MTNEIWTAGADPNRPWIANAPERCEYCGNTIWADEESECYVNRNGDADCPDAPRVTNPGGAVFGTISGIHEAA